jgi:hypothetical protein
LVSEQYKNKEYLQGQSAVSTLMMGMEEISLTPVFNSPLTTLIP